MFAVNTFAAGNAPIAFIASSKASSSALTTGNTPSIDTTGANFLVMAVGSFNSNPIVVASISDSKSNTWIGLTFKGPTGGATRVQLFYSASATVGSGHTFVATNGLSSFPSLCVAAFSNVAASPFDVENGATANTGTSLATGSITPGFNNELIIAGMGQSVITSNVAINSGMTLQETVAASSNNYSSAIAYKIQTSLAAINPTWSWTTSSDAAVVIASFKNA